MTTNTEIDAKKMEQFLANVNVLAELARSNPRIDINNLKKVQNPLTTWKNSYKPINGAI